MTPPAPIDPISAYLALVRRRLRRGALLEGAAIWTAVASGTALLLLLVAGAVGPTAGLRPLGLVVALAQAAGAAAVLVVSRRRYASDDEVARLAGRRIAGLDDQLLSAVQLSRGAAAGETHSGALVEELRRRVAVRIGELDPDRLVDLRPAARRLGIAAAAAACAFLLVALIQPGLLGRGLFALTTAAPERFATSAEPLVGDIDLSLVYPAYTSLPPRRIEGTSGHFAALPGTRVTVRGRALAPVHAGILRIEEEGAGEAARSVPVELEAGGGLSATFVVQKSGTWRFVLDGRRRMQEPEPHRIDLELDRPPRVELFAPAEVLEVAGMRRIELAYLAEDDFGVGDIDLVWRVDDGKEARRRVHAAQPERSASGKLEWDLGELELKPGSRVAYHLEARDNDDVVGPNVGQSRTFYLTIASPREKREAALAAEEELLEKAVAALADRLEAHLKEGDVEVVAGLHRGGEALLLALARASQALDADKRARGDVKKELKQMHERLGRLHQEEADWLADRKKGGAAARGAEAINGRLVAELERDVLALDDLLGRQRLEELLHVGDQMAEARDRLKKLLADYRKAPSDALKREIERELRELERQMRELQEKASRLAAELPDQYLNPEAMGKNGLKDGIERIRELLAQGDMDKALAELEKLSSSLDRMLAAMEGDLKSFRGERFSAEEKALAELEGKLSELAHDESEIRRETQAVRQRLSAELQKRMREKVEPIVKKAREEVAQLEKKLSSIEKRSLSPFEQEELGQVRDRVKELDRNLQTGDLDEARGLARGAAQALRSLSDDVRDGVERAFGRPRPGAREAAGTLDEGHKLAKNLADELDQALPRPGEMLGAEDQRRLSELAARQRATRRRAQEIERRLGEQRGGIPPGFDEGLRKVQRNMERAEVELQQKDARDAEGEESQALERLEKMQEDLREARRPTEQRDGRSGDREPVKIPGAEQYRAPREFRQDLLEAMKRPAPKAWKEQVQRYYEELVK